MIPEFKQVLSDISGGELHDELGQTLAEVVKAAMASGQTGELRLTIKVLPMEHKVRVEGSITAKLPRRKIDPMDMYATEDGGLLLQQLPLKDIPMGRTQPTREN